MKFLILTLIIFVSISCNYTNVITRNNGEVNVFSNIKNGVVERLLLHKNGTFEYNYDVGLIDSQCKGNWRMNNNNIFITTYDSFKFGIIDVQETVLSDDSRLFSIEILDGVNDPLSGSLVYINNNFDKTYEADLYGRVQVKETIFNKITISYLGENYEYNLKDTSANNLKITINPIELSKCTKDNELYKIKKNKLISLDGTVLKRE